MIIKKINLQSGSSTPMVDVVQYQSVSTIIGITLWNDDQKMNVADKNITIIADDGNLANPSFTIDSDNNMILMVVDNELTVELGELKIVVRITENESQIYSSFPLILNVSPGVPTAERHSSSFEVSAQEQISYSFKTISSTYYTSNAMISTNDISTTARAINARTESVTTNSVTERFVTMVNHTSYKTSTSSSYVESGEVKQFVSSDTYTAENEHRDNPYHSYTNQSYIHSSFYYPASALEYLYTDSYFTTQSDTVPTREIYSHSDTYMFNRYRTRISYLQEARTSSTCKIIENLVTTASSTKYITGSPSSDNVFTSIGITSVEYNRFAYYPAAYSEAIRYSITENAYTYNNVAATHYSTYYTEYVPATVTQWWHTDVSKETVYYTKTNYKVI